MARASGTGHLGTWSLVSLSRHIQRGRMWGGLALYEDVGILIETGGGSS